MDMQIPRFKAEFFKALAHPLRIRILEVLCEGERNVNEIQSIVGLEGSAVSQQLAVLRAKNLVNTVKSGTTVTYSLRDPLIRDLLAVAKQIFNNHLVETISVLEEMQQNP
ncbi:ArsR family transcriptional regulator [Paenibacillus yonginensis]|uniref:ArsR family transcriptional regulator n=2 Tax=Paenibacillus TaxID=44249 RepID=A0A1B1MW98_9BACL|nr:MULTISPECIES: metalloregulator ArsR/SmtB family transcription factor [Paenibacillus]ANS73456.1 ArsR family transcriptional regulator [Paenibacillus yonginensis]GGA28056.1 putative HTH-type transcriptional regulator [Paenibacillus physcomitrellae]